MPLLDGFRYLTPPAVSPKLSAPTEHLSGQRLLDGTFSNRCHHLLKTSLWKEASGAPPPSEVPGRGDTIRRRTSRAAAGRSLGIDGMARIAASRRPE